MPAINGRFYFKQTSNGNLVGEFSNHQSSDIYTESSDLIESSDNYVGIYYSTWREDRNPRFADLKISKKGSSKIFSLIWSDEKGTPIFKGEGMLCDDVLIGDYQSVS